MPEQAVLAALDDYFRQPDDLIGGSRRGGLAGRGIGCFIRKRRPADRKSERGHCHPAKPQELPPVQSLNARLTRVWKRCYVHLKTYYRLTWYYAI